MERMPKATHSGNWEVKNSSGEVIEIACYVMDNGERVLSLRGASRTMGLVGGGSTALVRNLNARWLSSYLSEGLKQWLYLANRNELPQYISDKGKKFLPFEASLFVDLCKAYVDALHDNIQMTDSQRAIADRMYVIMTAFAKTGLVAVIDEVTGYQDERDRTELQKILSKYISEELMPWTKRFPDEFYKQMFRLKGWDYHGKAKSPYAGTITNDYIYKYLPAGVLTQLREKNPRDSTSKNRKHRHHQFLTVDTGAKHLDNQLQQTIALMKASDNWEEFDRLFHRAMGEPCQEKLDDF
ncbi:P63C domain-containing protein [Intestinibacillus sp. NTUH-41-i26]|uniref:P63C domain-containing protein n=1 Tax=Intestinibacillus sp. NTUH-41-i26 TaxID=3079303 RepID=UPI00293477BF|nr:P63C domain-containing protein [Intestinibacillus sp. NTUH-41-i26]WOC74884.1 P63C domain-containing protein [Intestinibacillus sp. NTUH-41-i26]